MMSVPPPADAPTMSRTGFTGYDVDVCAMAGNGKVIAINVTTAVFKSVQRRMIFSSLMPANSDNIWRLTLDAVSVGDAVRSIVVHAPVAV